MPAVLGIGPRAADRLVLLLGHGLARAHLSLGLTPHLKHLVLPLLACLTGELALRLLPEPLAHEEVLRERLLRKVKRVVDHSEASRSLATERDLETPQEDALRVRDLAGFKV